MESTGLFMTMLMIYGDASEALHGTLYGATFHIVQYLGSSHRTRKALLALGMKHYRHSTSWLVAQ